MYRLTAHLLDEKPAVRQILLSHIQLLVIVRLEHLQLLTPANKGFHLGLHLTQVEPSNGELLFDLLAGNHIRLETQKQSSGL